MCRGLLCDCENRLWNRWSTTQHYGQGSAHFGPRFQSSLAGNEYEGAEVRRFVQYGSVITLKGSNNFPCAYLHSHHHQVIR